MPLHLLSKLETFLLRKSLILAALTTPVAFAGVPHAEDVQVGKFDCDVSSNIGVIVGSKQEASCVFDPSGDGAQKRYLGTITCFGVDVGKVDKGRLIWLVYAPRRGEQGSLEGIYRGVAANASVGIGVGANVLAGDGEHNLSLQPVSIEGEQGLNLAVGVSEFKLRKAL
ncbi:DUF992 domain-containing protein [Rhizobium leguminosarum]|nr:DUF992 domain-containing protein [Rhizobium leguminosarum]